MSTSSKQLTAFLWQTSLVSGRPFHLARMPDERPTSQHVVAAAEYGICTTPAKMEELTTSGKRAKDKRDKARKDRTAAESSNEGKGASQDSSSGQKK